MSSPSKRRGTPAPAPRLVHSATVVCDEAGPTPIPLPFPFERVCDAVVEGLLFPNAKAKSQWAGYFKSPSSVALMQDAFWWVVGECFLSGMEEVSSKLHMRAARSFASLYLEIPRSFKDAFLQVYYHAVAQTIWLSLCFSFPASQSSFDRRFRQRLLDLLAVWTQGIVPQCPDMSHWDSSGHLLLRSTKSIRAASKTTLAPTFAGPGYDLADPTRTWAGRSRRERALLASEELESIPVEPTESSEQVPCNLAHSGLLSVYLRGTEASKSSKKGAKHRPAQKFCSGKRPTRSPRQPWPGGPLPPSGQGSHRFVPPPRRDHPWQKSAAIQDVRSQSEQGFDILSLTYAEPADAKLPAASPVSPLADGPSNASESSWAWSSRGAVRAAAARSRGLFVPSNPDPPASHARHQRKPSPPSPKGVSKAPGRIVSTTGTSPYVSLNTRIKLTQNKHRRTVLSHDSVKAQLSSDAAAATRRTEQPGSPPGTGHRMGRSAHLFSERTRRLSSASMGTNYDRDHELDRATEPGVDPSDGTRHLGGPLLEEDGDAPPIDPSAVKSFDLTDISSRIGRLKGIPEYDVLAPRGMVEHLVALSSARSRSDRLSASQFGLHDPGPLVFPRSQETAGGLPGAPRALPDGSEPHSPPERRATATGPGHARLASTLGGVGEAAGPASGRDPGLTLGFSRRRDGPSPTDSFGLKANPEGYFEFPEPPSASDTAADTAAASAEWQHTVVEAYRLNRLQAIRETKLQQQESQAKQAFIRRQRNQATNPASVREFSNYLVSLRALREASSAEHTVEGGSGGVPAVAGRPKPRRYGSASTGDVSGSTSRSTSGAMLAAASRPSRSSKLRG